MPRRTLESVLAALRAHTSSATSYARIELGRGLLVLEREPTLWNTRFGSFKDLVEENHLCDWSAYTLFKEAEASFGSGLVDDIGYWAATRLVTVPAAGRRKVAEHFRHWLSGRLLMFPSYQLLDDWLAANYPQYFAVQKKTKRASVIERLRAERDRFQRSYERVARENRRLKEALLTLSA